MDLSIWLTDHLGIYLIVSNHGTRCWLYNGENHVQASASWDTATRDGCCEQSVQKCAWWKCHLVWSGIPSVSMIWIFPSPLYPESCRFEHTSTFFLITYCPLLNLFQNTEVSMVDKALSSQSKEPLFKRKSMQLPLLTRASRSTQVKRKTTDGAMGPVSCVGLQGKAGAPFPLSRENCLYSDVLTQCNDHAVLLTLAISEFLVHDQLF